MVKNKILLGQLLIQAGLITENQLQEALKIQHETGNLIGSTLLDLGYIKEDDLLLSVLARQLGVEYVDLSNIEIPPDVIQKVPAKYITHYQIMPFDVKDDHVFIAVENPLDLMTLDEVRLAIGTDIKVYMASKKDILANIRKYYGLGAETIEEMMDNIPYQGDAGELMEYSDSQDSEATIGKFLNQILLQAYRDGATDIHIEPYEDEICVRYRVDGILYDAKTPADLKHFRDSINSKIKILSNLNIAEKRSPQDGRFKVKVEGVELDLRVSFLPTAFGESVVLRVLNTNRLYSFSELGLSKEDEKILRTLIQKPYGIIFLTGPTGSGKTTTLYTCLSMINHADRKIITIEDPVEYQLKGITQIQINPSIDLTFAKGLRYLLRHDPDIMMVGEVRDLETAQTAIQVALTGHLVFSTLHTNDAAGGVTRLVDMGIEPYLINSTIECFIAQRLIRRVCDHCKEEALLSKDLVESFREVGAQEGIKIYRGKGCKKCNMTGYHGREGIYEFLLINDAVRDLVMQRATAKQIKRAAQSSGMKTLIQSGWEKICSGITTPEEVLRVTKEQGDDIDASISV